MEVKFYYHVELRGYIQRFLFLRFEDSTIESYGAPVAYVKQ